MTLTIRVLVLDDDLSVHKTLRALFVTAKDLRLVDEIIDLQQLPQRCLILHPHVVLIGGD